MNEVRGANQAVEPDIGLGREVMKHQRTAAQAVRADFERRPVCGERIESALPGLAGLFGNRAQQVVLAIVEHQFETPVCG